MSQSAATPQPYFAEKMKGRALAVMLGGLMMGLFLGALNQSIVNTALPRMVSELRGFELYAWVITAYMLTSTAVTPVVGKITDLYGARRFVIWGAVFFIVMTGLCGLAQSMTQLIVLRMLQGIGGGTIMAASFATVAQVLPPAQRARVNGLFTGTFMVASVLGPVIGGTLTDLVSWRAVFFVNVPISLLALVVLWFGFPDVRPGRKNVSVDVWGAVTIVASTILLLLTLSWGGVQFAWTSPQIIGLFCLTALLVGVFIWIEQRVAEPIVPLALFQNTIILVSIVGSVLQTMGLFAAVVFIPLFMQGVLGASATLSGSVSIPLTVAMLISSVANGYLLARTGRYRAFALGGFAVGTVGLYVLSTMGVDTNITAIMLLMLVLGLAIGFVGPTLTLAAQNSSQRGQIGVVTSLLQFARQMGSTVGTAIFGTILTLRFLPDVQTAMPRELAARLEGTLMEAVSAPQALLLPEAAAALQTTLEAAFVEQPEAVGLVFDAIRLGLATSLHWVFLSGAIVYGLGLITALFLRDQPPPANRGVRAEVRQAPVRVAPQAAAVLTPESRA